MRYQQTLDYLYSQLPMFQRIGSAAYKANLDNTIALSKHLRHPERAFRSIHVAGTNGKGSVSHMMASVLGEAGYKTGLATSPHLKDFRERIRINGQMIPKREVSSFVVANKDLFESIRPSFFEMTMALTFEYFAREEVDVAIIETGMGGRLDSSNIIVPELSIITNIGMDHVRFLGPNLTDIAWEKAGIIKPGVPVLIGKRQDETHAVFEEVARERAAPLHYATDMFRVGSYQLVSAKDRPLLQAEIIHEGGSDTLTIGLGGHYQLENLVTVLAAMKLLGEAGTYRADQPSLHRGLREVVKNTGLLGRWQQIGKRPRVLCDAGHNADGLKAVLSQLLTLEHAALHMVIGMVDDKDRQEILSLMPKEATYYFCKPAVPRGLDEKKLASEASFFGLTGKAYTSVMAALAAARKESGPKDLVFVGGSTFVIAEVI